MKRFMIECWNLIIVWFAKHKLNLFNLSKSAYDILFILGYMFYIRMIGDQVYCLGSDVLKNNKKVNKEITCYCN